MNVFPISLIALATDSADAELDQLKRIDHDDVTRVTYDPRIMTVKVYTDESPLQDGELEIMKAWAKNQGTKTRIGLLEQDGIETNDLVTSGFGKIVRALFTDPKTDQVQDGEFATGAIGSIKLAMRTRLLSWDGNDWTGLRPTVIRDWQPDFFGTIALIGRDSSLAYAQFDDLFEAIEARTDRVLFTDASRQHALSPEARLVRTIRGWGDNYAMVYDCQVQTAYGSDFSVVGFQGAFGPVMPVIDESKPGFVNTVVPTIGDAPKVQKFVRPEAAFTGQGNLAQRYAS